VLPPLPTEELRRAVELQALAVSPFPSDQLAWGCSFANSADRRDGRIHAELVLASRKGIDQYRAQRMSLDVEAEIWVRAVGQRDTAIGLHGYAENVRQRAQRRGWIMLGMILSVCAVLLLAIAITPVLQLRQRAVEAVSSFTELTERTRPHVAKREALLGANEQLRTLEAIVGNRLNPLQTMQELTVILGDDTVLQRLQVEGRSVTIAGQTPDTSAMMQKLSAQPGFKSVRAPTEFTIDEDLDPAAPTVPLAPASGASS
jgi:general secretion pathway protein L